MRVQCAFIILYSLKEVNVEAKAYGHINQIKHFFSRNSNVIFALAYCVSSFFYYMCASIDTFLARRKICFNERYIVRHCKFKYIGEIKVPVVQLTNRMSILICCLSTYYCFKCRMKIISGSSKTTYSLISRRDKTELSIIASLSFTCRIFSDKNNI